MVVLKFMVRWFMLDHLRLDHTSLQFKRIITQPWGEEVEIGKTVQDFTKQFNVLTKIISEN